MANKEHIFQISMNFDEDMALNAARDQAAGMIFGEVNRAVKDKYRSYYHGNDWYELAKDIVNEHLDSLIKECKDEIIELAADKIAARVSKTKAFKDKTGM